MKILIQPINFIFIGELKTSLPKCHLFQQSDKLKLMATIRERH